MSLRYSHPLTVLIVALVAVIIPFLGGCSHQPNLTQSSAGSSPASSSTLGSTLRIGYQKGDTMNILRLRGDLAKRLAPQGVKVEFVNFPAGPQMLEAIGVNSLDLGATGDAPPIFAQSAGVPLVYVANNPPGAGTSRAIIVPKGSSIHAVADLRGKKIAVQKGSATHNFLAQVLQRAGVPYNQVQPVYLAPPDARAAFDSGAIDAWAIWDPFLSIALHSTGARILINGAGIRSAGGYYLSSRSFATGHPELIRVALEEVEKTARWSATHRHDVAELIAPQLGVDVATWEQIQKNRPQRGPYVGFHPIDESVMAAQQEEADNFFHIGLLPHAVDVRQGLLSPQLYAQITPQLKPPAKLATTKLLTK